MMASWDSIQKQFIWLLFIGCLTSKLRGARPSISSPTDLGPCRWFTLKRDPSDCHYYYQCSGGRLYRYYCGQYAVFDDVTRSCVFKPYVGEDPCRSGVNVWPDRSMKANELVQCKENGYFRDKENCVKFVRCVNGVGFSFTCPDGMAFDEMSSACNYVTYGNDCVNGDDGNRRVDGRTSGVREDNEESPATLAQGFTEEAEEAETPQLRPLEEPLHHDSVRESSERSNVEVWRAMTNAAEDTRETDQLETIHRFQSVDEHISRVETESDSGFRNEMASHGQNEAPPDENFISSLASQWQQKGPLDTSPPKVSQMEAENSRHVRNSLGYGLSSRFPNHVDSKENPQKANGKEASYEPTRFPALNVLPSAETHSDIEVGKHGLGQPQGAGETHRDNEGGRLGAGQPQGAGAMQREKFIGGETRRTRALFHCTRDGYFRDPDDCAGFYQCFNGRPYHVRCHSGLVFNPVDGICDWLSRAPLCLGDHPGPEAPARRPPHPAVTSYINHGLMTDQRSRMGSILSRDHLTEPGGIRRHTLAAGLTGRRGSFECPSPWGQYQDRQDCSMFHACRGGVPTSLRCPQQLVFSKTRGMCDLAANVPECKVTPAVAGMRSIGRDFQSRRYGQYRKKYADYDNAHARRAPGYSQLPPGIDADKGSMGEASCAADGYSPHPTDCSQFIHCLRGRRHVRRCPPQLIYEPGLQYCVTRSVTSAQNCYDRLRATRHSEPSSGGSDRINDDARSPSIPTEVGRRQSAGPDPGGGQGGQRPPHPAIEVTHFSVFKCPSDGLYADDSDCTRFYRCMQSDVTMHTCDEGLAFNPRDQVCDVRHKIRECSSQEHSQGNHGDAGVPGFNSELIQDSGRTTGDPYYFTRQHISGSG